MTTSSSDRAPTCRILGQALLALVACAALAAPGCEALNKQGKYTAEHTSGAKAKMEAMKSANEYKMGEQAFFAGDLPKAQKHIETSITLNEKVAKSHVMLGRIKMEMGDLEAAQACFDKALKLDAKSVDSEYYQGILAERIDRREDALTHYLAAGTLDSANPQYAIAAAEMMIETGKIEDAEAFLSGRRNTFDHNAGINQTLGHIALLKSDPKTACTFFNEARLLAPDDQSIIEDLIRAEIATGQFTQAEYYLARIQTNKDNKNRRDLLQMRAACLVQIDRSVEAREILITLTQGREGASDVDAWVRLGEVCFVLHDAPRVKQAASRVVALAPQRPEGYILKALQLRRTGEFDAAKKNVETALTLGRTAEAYVLLGMIQQDLADTDGARLSYAAALNVDPKEVSAGKLLNALDQVAHAE